MFSSKRYIIVTANLLSRLLEDNICKLTELVEPEGKIIVSGISTKWTEDMEKVFADSRLHIIKHEVLESWNGFILSIS
jgi:ribosomal protein L11 methylase PrmA